MALVGTRRDGEEADGAYHRRVGELWLRRDDRVGDVVIN